MIRITAILFLLLPLSVLAQDRINKTKKEVKKELDKYVAANKNLQPLVSETDSTLTLLVNDPKSQLVGFVYSFNKPGQCISEKIIAACDSCIKKRLKMVLAEKARQWKKINGNQYISKFADQMLLELPMDNKDYSFTFYRAQWTKQVYDILVGH